MRTFSALIIGMFSCSFLLSSTALTKDEPAPWEQWAEHNPSWVEKIEPFRVIGNVYFVGSKGLSSFLITSETGHVVIDGGLPQNAPLIIENINELGFDVADVKILLNSHAHFDHSGGLHALKQTSGATLVASEEDCSALEGGFYLGYEDNINYTAPPVKVDQTIGDGETLTTGDIALTAHLTPGHTRGCTSWSMTVQEQKKSYDVLFFCGASVAGNSLVPPQYEGIVEDYKHTFEKTREWRPDVLLVNHPFYFDMIAKRKKQLAGDTFAFVDKGAFPDLMKQFETDFQKSLMNAEKARNAEKQ